MCNEIGVTHIDLLKIDAEGAELFILQGASELLKNQAIRAIQFEYGLKYRDSGAKLADIFELLTPYGFTIFRVLPDGLLLIDSVKEELECYRDTNYLSLLPDKLALIQK